MGTTSTGAQGTPEAAARGAIRGKIIEAEIKVSVDATRPLPFVCALYAIETAEGVWLVAYYGMNRGVFDYLPQKGAELDEAKLGIVFAKRQLIPAGEYQAAAWEAFRKANVITYGGKEE